MMKNMRSNIYDEVACHICRKQSHLLVELLPDAKLTQVYDVITQLKTLSLEYAEDKILFDISKANHAMLANEKIMHAFDLFGCQDNQNLHLILLVPEANANDYIEIQTKIQLSNLLVLSDIRQALFCL